MIRYKDMGGNSGVATYQVTNNGILVTFKDSSTYLYTKHSAGSTHVYKMKLLAAFGQGLHSYIQRCCRKGYVK